MTFSKVLCAACIAAAGVVATPAFARVDVAIEIGVPPPPAVVEVVPPPRVGYVWVPGYWGWNVDRHVWIHGRWVVARPGYHWMPERWIQAGPRWRLERGYWEHPGRGRPYGHERRGRRD